MAQSKKAAGPFGLTPLTEDFSIEQPDTTIDDKEEKRIRNLSKTKQWREFKEYVTNRQALYRLYLPGYNPLMTGGRTEANWEVADAIIRELQAAIDFIEGIAGASTL